MSYTASADGARMAAKDKQVKRLLLRSQRPCAVRHAVEGETEQSHFSNELWELCHSPTMCVRIKATASHAENSRGRRWEEAGVAI
jgi:hypothetical protein